MHDLLTTFKIYNKNNRFICKALDKTCSNFNISLIELIRILITEQQRFFIYGTLSFDKGLLTKLTKAADKI